ncbi:MAG: AAA family ATPase [Planctomycetaceae bacterium]|nr:AAA family ATPase [Planctomycetaceae bacterium]
MNDREQFGYLLTCRHPGIRMLTDEEQYALSIVRDVAMNRGRDVWLWSIGTGLRDGMIEDGTVQADTEHPAAALCRITRGDLKGLFVFLDLAGHLKDERTRRMFREAAQKMPGLNSTLVLIDACDDVPAVVASACTKMELSLPDEKEIKELIRRTVRQMNDEQRISVKLTGKDLSTIIRNLRGLTRRQAAQIIVEVLADDRRFNAQDINRILAGKRRALGDGTLLEYVESPTDLSEVGGLGRLKKWLAQREDSLSDEAVTFGLPAPRGLLMLGVQGAGKSLAAKAVATAWKRPLLRMDAGALYDKYIGESERRLRDALKQADMMAPIVLWIDEIEKAFASAASQSSDGGLSKRMFGTLLTWMQEHTAPVFLIATANDIEALPPELLRKGRFDEIFFVDLPTLDVRKQIFRIHLGKRKRDASLFDLDALAAASEGFSGAEIESAVISGLHDAYAAKQELADRHVADAIRTSPPLSVTMREKVQALRDWAVGRCVPAD